MSEGPSAIDRFFTNAQGLFDLIYELVTDAYKRGLINIEPELVKFAGRVIFTALDRKVVIHNFIKRSYPHWDKIMNKDEKFIIENANTVFVGLPLDKVNAFKDLFTNPDALTEDDKDAFWDYFESKVRISIIYLHENPNLVSELLGSNIEVKKLASIWKIKL